MQLGGEVHPDGWVGVRVSTLPTSPSQNHSAAFQGGVCNSHDARHMPPSCCLPATHAFPAPGHTTANRCFTAIVLLSRQQGTFWPRSLVTAMSLLNSQNRPGRPGIQKRILLRNMAVEITDPCPPLQAHFSCVTVSRHSLVTSSFSGEYLEGNWPGEKVRRKQAQHVLHGLGINRALHERTRPGYC